MAYVTVTRVLGHTLAERLSSMFRAIGVSARRRAAYDQTVRELNSLTNRELSDLGISRLNIQDVARAAAYGEQR